ncbi:hypothetical protein MYX06_01055 [Patescibacteria group bacterium AH-259-L05]|nr:hypothetical protein [Patescibacteria group bacterium AH-259-L05]
MKKLFVFILIIIFLAIAGLAVFKIFKKKQGSWFETIQTQASLQESVTKQTEINPVENLPETNVFEEIEINPFERGYKNPFK